MHMCHLLFADAFDYAPRVDEMTCNEPSLRTILFTYYMLGTGDQDRAKQCTNEYIAKLVEIYGTE